MLHYPNVFLGGAYLIIHNSWLQFGAYILLFQNAHHVPLRTLFPLILLVYWPTLRLWSEMAHTSLPTGAELFPHILPGDTVRQGKGLWSPLDILVFLSQSTCAHEPQM